MSTKGWVNTKKATIPPSPLFPLPLSCLVSLLVQLGSTVKNFPSWQWKSAPHSRTSRITRQEDLQDTRKSTRFPAVAIDFFSSSLVELNTKNETKRPVNRGRYVSFKVFNSSSGRLKNWLTESNNKKRQRQKKDREEGQNSDDNDDVENATSTGVWRRPDWTPKLKSNAPLFT